MQVFCDSSFSILSADFVANMTACLFLLKVERIFTHHIYVNIPSHTTFASSFCPMMITFVSLIYLYQLICVASYFVLLSCTFIKNAGYILLCIIDVCAYGYRHWLH